MNAKVRLRDVEASDLPLFFEHQRDPIAVTMVELSQEEASNDADASHVLLTLTE